ncbi:AAA family ATPase [Effusibacillus lacus]|uniref:Nuclease SbcCD subunit C n=1 Tax=Effusibacillus lacus TaxID=1348429 RepID=A0A292YPD9_9BACL|nr:AAA family ATPase [Effusibacillus lacus]TCS75717.1 exonuclease SbcC [Effusibacillus lacus]GAX91036.1 hypothetical protein EFBL_2696 [Effusibacillus lacus]
MKPVLLSIEGLHSFREKQTIRFDELTDAGVFGIFGPTGSGKSTILDALTLALYGTVGRAKNRTQGILNHSANSLEVSFQFQIGTGAHRRTFRVDRRYVRNTDISVKNKYSRLYELDANDEPLAVLADKDGEVSQRIQEILGLKPEDFTKAVVLPQGEFDQFLHLDGKNRRDMLQRLFALERYGVNLTKRLNERHLTTEQKLKEVTAEQTGMGDCSREAVKQAEQLHTAAIRKEEEAKNQLAAVQTKHDAAKQVLEWQRLLQETNRKLEQHALAGPDIEGLKDRLEMSRRADKVLPFVQRVEQLQSEEQTRLHEKNALQSTIETLRLETGSAFERYNQSKQLRETRQPELIKLQTQLDAAAALETEIETLNHKMQELEQQHADKTGEHADLQSTVQALTDRQQTLAEELLQQQAVMEQNDVTPEYRAAVQEALSKQEAYNLAFKDFSEAEKEWQRRNGEWKDAIARLETETANLQSKETEVTVSQEKLARMQEHPPAAQESLSEQEIRLLECKTKAEQLSRLEAESQRDSEKMSGLERDIQNLAAVRQAKADDLQQAQAQLDSLRHQYQQSVMQNKRVMAHALAADLREGEPCPVCGSHDHPHPVSTTELAERDSAEMEQLQRAIQAAEEQIQNLKAEVTAIDLNHSFILSQINDLNQATTARLEEIRGLRGELNLRLQKDRLNISGQQYLAEIEEWQNELASKRSEWASWNEQVRLTEAAIQRLKEEQANLKSNVAVGGHKVATAEKEADAARQALSMKEKDLDKAKEALQKALAAIGVDRAEDAAIELQTKDVLVRNAQLRRKELQTDLDRLGKTIAETQTTINRLNVELAGMTTQLAESREALFQKQQAWHRITNGVPAKELQQQVLDELAQLQETEKKTEQNYKEKSDRLQEAERLLTHAIARYDELISQMTVAEKELQARLLEENFTTAGEAKDAKLSPQETDEYEKRVQEHIEQGKTLSDEKGKLERNLAGQTLTEEEWLHIQQELADAEQDKQNATLALGAASLQLQELLAKHVRWNELEEQRAALAKQFGYLGRLKEILKGDRFVEFLAQEQLEIVARQASDRLKKLTRNRYALEVAEDGGFLMRDDSNGGVKRPVTSLSGGETFLTSLALALSLSSQIQLRGKYPLEFFFLDEGFGTLDPELLEVVMSTLEQLQLENMTIGIISHVSELQQRLHRRLVVEPAQPAGRGTRVRVERM